MPLYLHSLDAISPQGVFQSGQLPADPGRGEGSWLQSQHPDYKQFIAPAALRRMSPVIRMGLATSMSSLKAAGVEHPDAILMGTGLGCVRDTLTFLHQVIEQDEHLLNPTAFIQSTHNTVGGQIALALKCKAYNLTFTQESLSFESALLEDFMMAREQASHRILVGAADEVEEGSYALLKAAGCVRDATGCEDRMHLLKSEAPGALAGEGAAFFTLSGQAPQGGHPGKQVCFEDLLLLSEVADEATLDEAVAFFMKRNGLAASDLGLLVSGRNGDRLQRSWYDRLEALFPEAVQAVYKHWVGEYHTASAFGCYLATRVLQGATLPPAWTWSAAGGPHAGKAPRKALVINQDRGRDFSFILMGLR